jgi:hypothetical protein
MNVRSLKRRGIKNEKKNNFKARGFVIFVKQSKDDDGRGEKQIFK